MNTIINILIERDGITRDEAKSIVYDVRDRIISNPFNADEIIESELGLEPEYLDYLIY